MHGFPLMFYKTRKQMCGRKKKFATEQEAKEFIGRDSRLKTVYLCPFCCMYHMSSHDHTPRYEQERWWIIWHKEMETA